MRDKLLLGHSGSWLSADACPDRLHGGPTNDALCAIFCCGGGCNQPVMIAR